MPIEQERILALLETTESLLKAIENVSGIVIREKRLADENFIAPADALRNLEALLTPEGLIEDVTGVKLVIERERMRLTPARIKENQRRARKARAKRGQQPTIDDAEFEL